jgi:signal-transduction protein with cAMP-binding, CBS, and nucleotidyltransferase domain
MVDSGRQPSTAFDIMSPIKSAPSSMQVSKAMHRMHELETRSIMVEPDRDNSWGIVTQRDIVTKVLGPNRSVDEVTVGDIANRKLYSIPPDTHLQMVAESLRHHNVRRLVVEVKGVPIGIVSQTDLIQIVEEFGWGWGFDE